MSRDTPNTEYGTQKDPPNEGPSLIIRIGLVFFTILILLASQELWVRYLVLKSNAERLEVLKQFIYNSEKNQGGFGLQLPERNIEGHTFLEQTVSPDDFASFSPKQKRIFIETFYRDLGIKPPPDPKYFHPKHKRQWFWQK